MVTVEVQTHLQTEDQCTETSIVWSTHGFRCTLCSKPPRLPGPQIVPPFVRERRQRRTDRRASRSEERETCETGHLQGTWTLTGQSAPGQCSQWMQRFTIIGQYALDSEGKKFRLRQDEHGDVTLAGGALYLQEDGSLLRAGKTGAFFFFTRTGLTSQDLQSHHGHTVQFPVEMQDIDDQESVASSARTLTTDLEDLLSNETLVAELEEEAEKNMLLPQPIVKIVAQNADRTETLPAQNTLSTLADTYAATNAFGFNRSTSDQDSSIEHFGSTST